MKRNTIRIDTMLGPIYGTRKIVAALKQAAQADGAFADLGHVHHNTLRTLEDRDYIQAEHVSSRRYRITARGRRALATLTRPSERRRDGLCPHCGKRPRHYTDGGRSSGYCHECKLELSRRQYHRRGKYRQREPGICSRCHERPRHCSRSGRYYAYCRECTEAIRIEQIEKANARAEAGNAPRCAVEGCNRPRSITARSQSAYCAEHKRAYGRRWYSQHRRRQNQESAA